ncbi:flagellar basal body-associated FliL family protein [Treponema pectinovorum]|uniref:hypothetical protein n=1 Tax=Treponema pectinovorum TaxID=164 RepID=UPI0011C8A488|nr:hypothetical protein [Treponema pectinovorum]
MENRLLLLSLLCLFFSSCSAQNLNISVKNNSTNYSEPQVFYWINNNTGEEIKNIEWSLNGSYFYTADLSASGDRLDLFDFAKPDGTRYNYYLVKPIELKAKCKQGHYSIKVDDIPINFGATPIDSKYVVAKEIFSWSKEFNTTNKTRDGATVSWSVVFAYKFDDKNVSTEITQNKSAIINYLQQFISQKTIKEFSPKNEDILREEIKNYINNNIFNSSKICDVRFLELDLNVN